MFEVCEYQGNFYIREVHPNDTTVYMDYVHETFDDEDEATIYCQYLEDEHDHFSY